MVVKAKRNLIAFAGIGVLLIAGVLLLATRKDAGSDTPGNDTIRVAWMTSWATTGQVVEALIHTDILQRRGVNAEFKSFLFGPPMNEAAIAGQVDVTVVGDMPAIILLARSGGWSVVSRTIYFPYGLMVRSDLAIETISDLKGATIGVPFGSGPQPTLYRWLEEAGLRLGETVTVINLLPNEMPEAIQARRVEAIMTWEPTMTVLEQRGAVRVLKETRGVGFLCVSNDFIERHPDVVRGFVEAWAEALYYTSTHRTETDAWFAEDSRFPTELLAQIRVVDENFQVNRVEDVHLRLTEEDIAKNQEKAGFAFEQELIPKRLDLPTRIRQYAPH